MNFWLFHSCDLKLFASVMRPGSLWVVMYSIGKTQCSIPPLAKELPISGLVKQVKHRKKSWSFVFSMGLERNLDPSSTQKMKTSTNTLFSLVARMSSLNGTEACLAQYAENIEPKLPVGIQ